MRHPPVDLTCEHPLRSGGRFLSPRARIVLAWIGGWLLCFLVTTFSLIIWNAMASIENDEVLRMITLGCGAGTLGSALFTARKRLSDGYLYILLSPGMVVGLLDLSAFFSSTTSDIMIAANTFGSHGVILLGMTAVVPLLAWLFWRLRDRFSR